MELKDSMVLCSINHVHVMALGGTIAVTLLLSLSNTSFDHLFPSLFNFEPNCVGLQVIVKNNSSFPSNVA